MVRLVPLQHQKYDRKFVVCPVDSTTSGDAAEAVEDTCFFFRSSQEDAPCTDESALVARFRVQLLLERDPTTPSSISQVKKRKEPISSTLAC